MILKAKSHTQVGREEIKKIKKYVCIDKAENENKATEN